MDGGLNIVDQTQTTGIYVELFNMLILYYK